MYYLKLILAFILIKICVKKTISLSLRAPHVQEHEDSICTTVVSYLNSRYVPYEETYKHKFLGIFYKTKTRVNYQTEYYTDWRLEKQCCAGYISNGSDCSPICHPQCINGICRKPYICECSPHYMKSSGPEAQDHVCVPICTNECVNGKCVQPDACSCDKGYWMDSDGFTCRPSCEPNCENGNGYCVAPNTCSCHLGYTVSELSIEKVWNASEHTKCVPYCGASGCEHGTCVAPNKCECNDGYEPLTRHPEDPMKLVKCVPKCHGGCLNGDCVAPDTCLCNNGYARNDRNECVPACSKPCINGVCTQPEVCVCSEGFAHEFGKDPSVCFPICEKECVGGNCTAPNTCTCPEGYVLISEPSETRCKPVCDLPCGPYGYCSEHNVCACNEGYQLAPTDKKSQQDNRIICEPMCTVPCEPNSSCTAPDNCTCDTGYEPSTTGNETLRCQTICEVSCGNGICTSPNTCSCDVGYEINENGTCVPTCSTSCANGTCVEPDICQCDDGFFRRNDTSCEPFCEDCENGDCIAPYKCRCHDGFIDSDNETNAGCIEACTRDCSGHGTCVYEEKPCVCMHGWDGWNCEEPTICTLTVDENHINRERIQIVIKINDTQTDIYSGLPYCNECTDSLDNETVCFDFHSLKENGRSTITCHLSTGLPCYEAHKYNAVSNYSKLTGSIIAAIVFVVLGTTVAGYLGYRRYHKRSPLVTLPNDHQGSSLQGPAVTEALISEEAVYL